MIIGVVGKANVGKSTFFKAATLAEVEIANYPFATIKPNHGIGYVKVDCVDKHFNKQCNPREGFCIDHKRFIPVNMIDVAGLVPGAHEGKGMGNQFLNDLNQANALIHVIDVSGSTNEKGESVDAGSYNPEADVEFLEVELDHWYKNILEKGWERLARQIQQEHLQVARVLGKQLSGMGVDEDLVKQAMNELDLNQETVIKWTHDDLFRLAAYLRKKSKPMIIAANKIDVPGAKENYERIKEKYKDMIIIPCSAESELALREAHKHGLIKYIPGEKDFEIIDESKMNDKQKKALEFIKTNVLQKNDFGSGVQNIINSAVFDLLKYIYIYPGGVSKLEDSEGRVLPDCFLMPHGTTSLDFAYRLHSDFGDNFVKAIDVKKKMPLGKDHKLQSGDVIEIMANK